VASRPGSFMDTQLQEIAPVLDQVIEFMESALTEKQADSGKIQELATNLKKAKEDQEKVILEKVAVAKSEFFNEDKMNTALAKIEGMGIIDEPNREKMAKRIKDDPNFVFPFMVKMAETIMSIPGEGRGIDKLSNDEIEEDPDGWKAFAEGRRVAVKQ
jgi:hypothetical protein